MTARDLSLLNAVTREMYLFFRKEGFYPLELGSDKEAKTNAEHNPGTVKVERVDQTTGKSTVVWRQQ